MTVPSRVIHVLGPACLALALVACGGQPATTPRATAPPAAPAPTNAMPATGKVSANTASEEEIAAALERAGVPNADQWAEEVVEYRPYPVDDPNLGELRQELAKYNASPQTVDQIVSVLTP